MREEAKQNNNDKNKIPLWTKDFIAICIVNFIIFAAFQLLMPVVPQYAFYLGGDERIAGYVVGIFTISAVLIRPWIGFELDRRGRKAIFIIGLAIFVFAVLGYIWFPVLVSLLLFRVIHGFGWAGSTTAAGAIVADIIPPQRRGEGMGYYGMFSNLAMAVGPALGLFLITNISFNSAFYVSAILAAIAFFLALFLRVPPILKGEGENKPVFFEPTSFQPGLIMFFVTLTWGGIVSFLPAYAFSLGLEDIGIYFTIYAIVLMAIRPFAGMISDRYGSGVVLVPGLICVSLAMLIISYAHTLPVFLLAAVLNGIGFGSTHPTLQALTVTRAPVSRRGAANATFFSAFDLGIGLGAVILGNVAHWFSYALMYRLASLSGIIGLVVFLLDRWLNKRNVTQEAGADFNMR